MNINYTIVESLLRHKGEFVVAAEAVAYARCAMSEFHQVAVVSTSKEIINQVQAAWNARKGEYDVCAIGHKDVEGRRWFLMVTSHEDDQDESDDLLKSVLAEAARNVKKVRLPPQSEKPAASREKVSLPAQGAAATPQNSTFPKGVTTVNNNNQKPATFKFYMSLIDRGGRQAATGHRIVTALVSDPYVAGKNADGSDKVGFAHKHTFSMVIPENVARKFAWEKTDDETALKTRALFYGTLAQDKRPKPVGARFQETITWANPLTKKRAGLKDDGTPNWIDCSEDDPAGELMLFPLEKRREPAFAAKPIASKVIAPAVEAPKAETTPAAKVKAAATKKVAKVAKVSTSEIAF